MRSRIFPQLGGTEDRKPGGPQSVGIAKMCDIEQEVLGSEGLVAPMTSADVALRHPLL